MLPHAPRCMNQLIPRRGRAVHRRLGWKSWALQPRDSFLPTCRCWMLMPRPPARCNIGLEVALPWQWIRAPASSRPDADTQTLTGSQQAKRMLSADQICTFNRSLNTKRRHGSVFGCQVFPDSHFRLFFLKKKKVKRVTKRVIWGEPFSEKHSAVDVIWKCIFGPNTEDGSVWLFRQVVLSSVSQRYLEIILNAS